jgi:hypothetical protein
VCWIVRFGADTRRMTTIPDWLAIAGLLVPSATGLAGYVLAGRNDQARDDRAAKREVAARKATVRERLDEQRHAFQRETLLELQDVLQRRVRATAKVNLHDRQKLEQQSPLTMLGDDLNNESYELGVATRRLQERVLDKGLREAVEAFRQQVTNSELSFMAVRAMSPEEGIRQLDADLLSLTNDYVAVSGAIGEALRAELGWLPGEGESD